MIDKNKINYEIARELFAGTCIATINIPGEGVFCGDEKMNFFENENHSFLLLDANVSLMHPAYSGETGFRALALRKRGEPFEVSNDCAKTAIAMAFHKARCEGGAGCELQKQEK